MGSLAAGLVVGVALGACGGGSAPTDTPAPRR